MAKDKFLVDLLKSTNERQLFFFIWAFIVGLFTYLMYAFFKSTQRRNFREDGQKTSKSVVPYEPKVPKK